MRDDKLISQLLARWEDAQEQGQTLPAEELCRDHPELMEQIKRQIEALKAFNTAFHLRAPESTVDVPPRGGVAPPVVTGYEILGELGRGGMGVVFKAWQVNLRRVVALKMVLAGAHAGPQELARFRTEAEAVARLQHPNIVQIHEVGEQDGNPFFSLEFVEGGSLDRKLGGTLMSARPAARLVETLARAMHYAHERGVVHRDLKPANVLLTADDTPKITDFGLAKRIDTPTGQTQTGTVLGTPSFMAPEQARPGEIGPATDIYALGGVLYNLLTGRPPFLAESAWETISQVISTEPVPPARLQPTVPRDLDTICLKCLHKAPGNRYARALDLADDLHRFLIGETIQARQATLVERAIKWARRKPTLAALAVVSSLGLVAFMAAILLYARYQSQQADIFKQELATVHYLQEVREEISQSLLRAKQHEIAGRWSEADTELRAAQAVLETNRDLRADKLRTEVTRRRAGVRQQLNLQEQQQQAKKRFQKFQTLYDDALFHETLFTGLDPADNRDKARLAARSALALYGLDQERVSSESPAPLLESDRLHLEAAEHARLASDCYELLLIWAETEAEPKAADHALTLLARAARLGKSIGLDTRAYHFRKARYLALSKGEKVDRLRIEPGAPGKPTGALDWFLEALERYRAADYAQASRACAEVFRYQGDHFWARYVQALCHLRAGRWVEGKAELTVCLNRRPDFVWPHLLRGLASSELGAKHQEQAEYDVAQADLDFALRKDRTALAQYVGLVNRGVLFIRQRRYDEAIADLKEAIRRNPAGYQGYINLAQAYQGANKWDQAIAALDQAIAQAPDLPLLYENRARVYLQRQNKAAAKADFAQAIAREPRGSTSLRLVSNEVELGRLLQAEQDFEAALAHFEAALRIKSDFALAHRLRAEALLALNRRAEAGAALDRYLALTAQPSAEVYQARGLLHARAKQYGSAIEMYTLALRKAPEDLATRRYRGWTYLLMDAARPALADFEECLRRKPTNADALVGRGNARVRLRLLDEAIADAEEAEKHGPVTDRLLYNVTCIYALAASQLALEVRLGRDRQAPRKLARYENKALACLQRTLEKLPPKRRAAFWREQIQTDPALAALRRTPDYSRLAALYGREK